MDNDNLYEISETTGKMIFYSKRFIWLISCLAVILWIVNAFKDYRKCGYKRTFELQALLSRRKAKQVSSSPTIQDIGNDLCAEKVLSDTEILRFARDGHIFSKDLLDVDFISYQLYPSIQSAFKAKQLKAMQHLVQVVTNDVDALPSGIEECQDILRKAVQPSDIPFLQLFHLWREHDVAKRIACSPALGKIAAQLLGVPAVRLYQDSLFVKRPGDGPTEWHSDLNMAPLDTNSYITCWIPLHNVPRGEDGGSGLAYGTGSHRDFSLLYCELNCFSTLFSFIKQFLNCCCRARSSSR